MEIKSYLQQIYVGDGWWNVDRFWRRLENLAAQRDSQKLHYRSTKNWSNGSTHLLGLVAEMAFSLEAGIGLDAKLRAGGDPGFDFVHEEKQYDIKGTQYWYDPHLKQYPNPKRWVDYYLLAGIKKNERHVKVFGWVDKDTLQNAPLKDYGHGPQRSISYDEMNQGMPPWLPSLREKFNITEPQ